MSEPEVPPPVQGRKRGGDAWHVKLLLRSLLLWGALYAALLTLYNATYHLTSGVVIGRLQVVPSIWLLQKTLPEMPLWHTTTSIHCHALRLDILRGCDGMEAWLMLVSALLVFPMPWMRKCSGVAGGTILVFGLNLLRIVSLFHIALKRPELMEIAHGVIWQGVIVLAAAAFVLIWLAPDGEGRATREGSA